MLYIMLIFSIIGGIDKLLGNKYGLGVKFEEGFKAIGGLCLTIIGIYSISPVIAKGITPVLEPLARIFNADPSVFISSILATDLGAYTTSMEIAIDPLVGKFNGLILASMLGTTISFTIPVATNLISVKDFPYFAKGILAGIATVPIGMIVSGLLMKVPVMSIIFNTIPVIIFSVLIVVGLIKKQDKIIKVFKILGKFVLFISTSGLILSILEYQFGIQILKGMVPFEEGAIICVNIGIVLSGTYPLLFFISRRLHKYLNRISIKYDLDQFSILALVSMLASCIPMFGIYEEMNWKGKILNAAFAVSGAFTFGGQLGYISSVAPETVNSFMVGKIVAGFSGLALAVILIKLENINREGSEYAD